MTTPRQLKLYWKEWRAVERIVAGAINRHDLHREALGYDKSSRALSNKEFDKILSHFRAISRPDDINAQLRIIAQPKIRLMHLIVELVKQLATELGTVEAGEAYLAKLLHDRFHAVTIDDLDLTELPHLRDTLKARIRSLHARRIEAAFPVQPAPQLSLMDFAKSL